MKVKENIHKNGIREIIKGVIKNPSRKSITMINKEKIKGVIKKLIHKMRVTKIGGDRPWYQSTIS